MNTTTESTQEVIAILSRLQEACKEGQEGYAAAANAIRNTDLKKLFKTYSRQRGQFVDELRAELRRLGGTSEKSAGAGSVHKGWFTRSGSPAEDEGVVIAECERGEDRAVKAYEDALASQLPEDLQTLVKHQFLQVEESHDLIRALEKATK
jgi:uncharacterized protein (TIGR02284 family)